MNSQKQTSKLPTIKKSDNLHPKVTVLQNSNLKTFSTLKKNCDSVPENSKIAPKRILRRSKSSFAISGGMNTFKKPSNSTSIFTATIKNPLKRPLKLDNVTVDKKSKLTEEKQNIPPKARPKPAPYDFKTKFNYVKEDYDKLKHTFRELKEKNQSVSDENEDLLRKSEILQIENGELQNNYETAASKLKEVQAKYDKLFFENTELSTNNNKLQIELNDTTNKLKEFSKELNEIKESYKNSSQQLEAALKELEYFKLRTTNLERDLCKFETNQRKLHNIIQELKGNIRVFCRIRPQLEDEKHKLLYNVNYVDEKTIEVIKNDKRSEFTFDVVYGPNSKQGDIFEELSQLVQSALEGYNICIFAYGQTGSGKTYTMDGIDNNSADELGMIPRSIQRIFKGIKEFENLGWQYTVTSSFLEIYNENIIDLLEPKKSNLEIRMVNSKSNDVYVTNLTVLTVENAEELLYHFEVAQRNRATAATENNERSSRSHAVTKIVIEGVNKQRNERCIGSLNLVDLAGSEKYHTSETTRLRETNNINRSLSNLSNVILALVKKSSHIPYRNSKLTHLLMPCLGGNSKTLMLVNISPLEDCFAESVNSLRFATNVNQCKTGTIRKMKTIV